MQKLVICNWKENPSSLREALALAQESDESNVIIAPPFPFIGAVKSVVRQALIGAQDVFHEARGAFTGSVSASQLSSVGVKYVIIGHSERRRLGDTDEIIAKKVSVSSEAGIVPILCVGEMYADHEKGRAREIVLRELTAGLSLILQHHAAHVIIAYEPVWAISTEARAKPDTPQHASDMLHYIREVVSAMAPTLRSQYVYGGSVTLENAEAFLKESAIEGALVGGASLRGADIKKIISVAKHN